jgi:hypothetical protein
VIFRGAALGALLGVLAADLGLGLLTLGEGIGSIVAAFMVCLCAIAFVAILAGPCALALALPLAAVIRRLALGGVSFRARQGIALVSGVPLGLADLAIVGNLFGGSLTNGDLPSLILPAAAGGLGLGLGVALGVTGGER